jgi:hemolysin III
VITRLRKWIKDPFCGLSHGAGAALAVAGLVVLILLAQGRPLHVTSFAVYGVTLVTLYVASALFHSLRVDKRAEGALYGFDRAAIYALIAGTYTPVCLIALPPAWGWGLLGAVWGLAVLGVVIDIVSKRNVPDWLQALLYLATGWVMLVALKPLYLALSPLALAYLFAGCLIYTVGAVICVKDWPHLKRGVFGAHELWHALVLAGSACHFALMVLLAIRH